jgi:hypothetical protein
MVSLYKSYILFFTTIFVLQTTCGFSQEDNPFLNFGITVPVGKFGKQQPQNPRSGYAQRGYVIDFGQKYYKEGRKYGYIYSGYFQYFPTNHGNLLDERSRRTPNAGDIREGSWQNLGFLVGAFKIFSLQEKLSIETGGLIGLSGTRSPNLQAHNLDGPPGYPHSIEINMDESSYNLSFLIKTTLKYDISKRFYVLTNIDFFGVSPKFDDRKITDNFFWHEEKLTFRQPFYTFNFTLGMGYSFKHKEKK